MPIMNNIGNVQYVLLAIVGGALALHGAGVTLGVIASFLQLSKSFTQPISQISQQLNSVIMALAGAGGSLRSWMKSRSRTRATSRWSMPGTRVRNWLEADERTGGVGLEAPPFRRHRDVYLSLRATCASLTWTLAMTRKKPILHNISLYAKPGQKVAFVGATGAGKTTITNLINRFYDIADGKIRYDGININKIKKERPAQRSLGIVLQETNLFTGTVREKHPLWPPGRHRRGGGGGRQAGGAHDFILRLPKGYDTVIAGDGGSCPRGQRQLLSIARAAVADPPVMILDEATSSIDTRTESIVQAGHGPPDGGPHGVCHRPPAVHDQPKCLPGGG